MAVQHNVNRGTHMSQKNTGKKVAMAMTALVSGLVAVPVIAFVNAFAGIVLLGVPVAMVFMAS